MSHILCESAWLLSASIAYAEGNQQRGDDLLADALALGAEHGIVPVPTPTRITLAPLCRRALSRSIHPDYARMLVRKCQLELELDSHEQPARGARSVRASPVPRHFAKALRAALRRLHEAHRFAESPLLECRLVAERTGARADLPARVTALASLLRETIRLLAGNARTEAAYRALFHTYIEPAPTQLLAAESAQLSFGTYRRHLAGGLDEVATALWLREQALSTKDD